MNSSSAAFKRGANLVCLVGRNLRWIEDHFFEGNVLYKLVDKEQYDGVVTWAGTGVALGQYATQEEMAAFFQDLAPLPVVNYEKVIPGLHCVRTDTLVDMQIILSHLIVDHNRRKILLIRGPEHHFETEERIRAYRESLAAFEIPFDPALILPRSYPLIQKRFIGSSRPIGAPATRRLISVHQPSFGRNNPD